MVVNMSTVTALLDGLNEKERRELHDSLQFEFNRTKKVKADHFTFSPNEEVVWIALCQTLNQTGRSLPRFVETFGLSAYQEAVEVVDVFVTQNCGLRIIRRVERIALLSRCFVCLQNWMSDARIPISATSMLRNAAYLSDSVERAFPGYAASGLLLRLVVRRNA